MKIPLTPTWQIAIPPELIVCLIILVGLIIWLLLKIKLRWLKVSSIVLLLAVPTLATLLWGAFLYGVWIGIWHETISESTGGALADVRALRVIESLEKGETVDPWLKHNVIHNLENHIDIDLLNHKEFINNRDDLDNKMVVWLFGAYDDSFKTQMPEVVAYRKTHKGNEYWKGFDEVLEKYAASNK